MQAVKAPTCPGFVTSHSVKGKFLSVAATRMCTSLYLLDNRVLLMPSVGVRDNTIFSVFCHLDSKEPLLTVCRPSGWMNLIRCNCLHG